MLISPWLVQASLDFINREEPLSMSRSWSLSREMSDVNEEGLVFGYVYDHGSFGGTAYNSNPWAIDDPTWQKA